MPLAFLIQLKRYLQEIIIILIFAQMEQNQRHLNFNKFVEERSVEIAKFLADLEMDTKKKGHQALPRSIRRRAMSHNRYRIPRKLRKNMEDDLAKAEKMQKIPKCRKHIRKRRNLVMAYKLRSSKLQWLSTHLWSARRMRMVGYYGYKVALTANNKCFRSAYRHFQHNCCLLDLSYFNCLSLKFQEESFPSLIRLQSAEILPSFDKIYEVEVFSSSSRQRLICPAYLIRFKQDQFALNLKIFFHPGARDEISKLSFETKCSAVIEQGQCDLYLLVGPQSTNVLTSALKQYGISLEEQSLNSLFYDCKHKLTYLSKEDNFQIVNKPQVDCPVPLEKQLKKQYNQNENTSLREKMLKMFQNMKNQKLSSYNGQKSNDLFWDYYKTGQNKDLQETIFKVTLRSRYTHKRKNKVSKEEKKKIAKVQRESPKQRKSKRQNSMQDENQLSSSLNFSKQIYLETPIHKNAVLEEIHPIALGQIGEGMMKGLLLLCSNSHSCKLWRILSHCHLKVIGRRQYAHMHLQSSKLLFPQNYAQTRTFAKYLSEKQQNLFARYSRIPLKKQPHYFSINSPYPFGITPVQPLLVCVQMVGKGKCFEMSYICQLQETDLALISSSLQNGKVGIIASEAKEETETERKHYKTLEQIESDLRLSEPSRKIIGQITTGGYLFNRSKQGGVGFVDLALTSKSYLQKFGNYVFIRKASSRHYMLALITNFYN